MYCCSFTNCDFETDNPDDDLKFVGHIKVGIDTIPEYRCWEHHTSHTTSQHEDENFGTKAGGPSFYQDLTHCAICISERNAELAEQSHFNEYATKVEGVLRLYRDGLLSVNYVTNRISELLEEYSAN